MHAYQTNLLDLALRCGALGFGEFTLKSGRVSPYFFNAGLFNDGEALATLGSSYAEAANASDIAFDCVFGPAYKGIPIAAVAAAELASKHGKNVSYCYDRKEAKTHGEGGKLVGASLEGKRVLIIDDVITAGTAIRGAIETIEQAGGAIAGVAVALDRQERGQGELSAIQELAANTGIPVVSIVTLADLIEHAAGDSTLQAELPKLEAYRAEYGV